jgi:hypothetical protein
MFAFSIYRYTLSEHHSKEGGQMRGVADQRATTAVAFLLICSHSGPWWAANVSVAGSNPTWCRLGTFATGAGPVLGAGTYAWQPEWRCASHWANVDAGVVITSIRERVMHRTSLTTPRRAASSCLPVWSGAMYTGLPVTLPKKATSAAAIFVQVTPCALLDECANLFPK